MDSNIHFLHVGVNLTEIIIKRTEADALANMTFGNNWNKSTNTASDIYAPVTYNPNYTE